MPVQAAFNLRSGYNKMLLVGQTLCRLINLNASVIRTRYADRPQALALLTAIEAVCALLPAAQQEQAEMDAMSAPAFNPPGDVSFPGQD